MKYMNWSYDQLMECPVYLFEQIFLYAADEAKQAKARERARSRGGQTFG